MAQELRRTGRRAISSGTEDRDQITDLGPRKTAFFSQTIERRAEAADHAGLFLDRRVEQIGRAHV